MIPEHEPVLSAAVVAKSDLGEVVGRRTKKFWSLQNLWQSEMQELTERRMANKLCLGTARRVKLVPAFYPWGWELLDQLFCPN